MKFKVQDHYFKKAKKENFLARSIYKLEEIDSKYNILGPGNLVVDFGYHPGSWIQYTAEKVGPSGQVVGIDIRPVGKVVEALKNVRVYEKDIFDVKELSELGVERTFDVVLSDMAPNTTGIRSVDQDRSLNLVEMVFELLPKFLKNEGNMVVKVFESQAARDFLKEKRPLFKEFHSLRPKSTRSVSKEFFVIAKGFKA